jgi:hypothetical protein
VCEILIKYTQKFIISLPEQFIPKLVLVVVLVEKLVETVLFAIVDEPSVEVLVDILLLELVCILGVVFKVGVMKRV